MMAGCGEPPKPAVPAAPPDEWASLPKSPQWLYAVGDFSGPHKEECAEAKKWIVGEAECKASACENAKELAKDWEARCAKLAADDLPAVKEALGKFVERAAQPDTPCMAQLKPILQGKCGEDATCEVAAQKWATRCAATDGSPLGVRILVTFVQRRVKDHEVELDLRPCADLKGDIVAGLACTDRFKCEAAAEKIDLYKARCQDEDDRPTVALALAEMVIFAGADRKLEPILAVADDESAADIRAKLPPAVADGSAIVLNVCGERVASLDAYFAARKECEQGAPIQFARPFKASGGFEVRVGSIAAGYPAKALSRYPSLLMAGERGAFEKARAEAFDAELSAAVKLALDPKTAVEAARALHALLRGRGRDIYRSESMRASISAKDAAFIAAFKEIGKAKGAAKGDKAELASIARRGQAHAFADLNEDGSVQFGAVSWATLFDTSALLPLSHAAYLTAMKPLLKKTAKEQPSEEVDAAEARMFGQIADDCHQGVLRAAVAEKELLDRVFGVQPYDASKADELGEAIDSGHAKAETAFLTASIFQMTAAGKANEFYKKVMATAECTAPSF